MFYFKQVNTKVSNLHLIVEFICHHTFIVLNLYHLFYKRILLVKNKLHLFNMNQVTYM